MFEALRIKIFGTQPAARVTDQILDRLIHRDFGDQADKVKLKLGKIASDTGKGKNRICAAIIKLSKKDPEAIDNYIEMCKNDFRDVISQAEYPGSTKAGFNQREKLNMKRIYLADWIEYSKWINE